MDKLFKQTKKEWDQIFNSITDSISVHDRDFTIIKANQALADFLGMQVETIIGKKCFKILPNWW